MNSSNEVIIKIFFLCPVPNDQKPINEYIDLKENPLTNWISISKKKYKLKISSLLFLFLFLVFLFSSTFYQIYQKDILKWVISSFFVTFSFFSFFLFLNLVNWVELNKRLKTPQLLYEEGSWYDGKIWKKPFSLMKNEKLISVQKIEPIIQRLKNSIFITLFFTLVILPFFI
jgi:hypothetical protein